VFGEGANFGGVWETLGANFQRLGAYPFQNPLPSPLNQSMLFLQLYKTTQ